MSWENLLVSENGTTKVLPWTGGRKVYGDGREWAIKGRLPQEVGWFSFDVGGGRKATLVGPSEPDLDYDQDRQVYRGYLVGDRLIRDDAKVVPDPHKLIGQTHPVMLVEPGLDRFARAVVAEREDGELIFLRQEFPAGPELEVEIAYQDRKDSVSHIKDVTPALDLAFRWLSHQRHLAEERRAEEARKQAEEEALRQQQERLRRLREKLGRPDFRREIAAQDFETAAKAALAVSNSELLDFRPGYRANEMVVQYKVRHRRLECVVDKATLRVIDAGICLEDHATGEKGDTRFTLESLPSVVGEALDLNKLVVWRHVPGDQAHEHDYEDDPW